MKARRIMTAAVAAGLTGALALGGASAAFADDNGGRGTSQSGDRGQMHRGGGPLGGLIASGTITKADAEAVKTALKAAHDTDRSAKRAEHEQAETEALAGLVKAGTITQAQADAIASADRRGMRDLVSNGTLTQAQATAVKTALKAAHDARRTAEQAERKAETTKALADLVSAGTLTQAKADAIATALAEAPAKGGHGKGGHGKDSRGKGGPRAGR